MINAEQIRAARGMLDWSTADLARITGLTINGINKIERGHVDAQRDTLEAIEKAFEEAGLEFLPASGLRKKDRMVQIIEGDDARKKLANDIYYTLRDTGGEILAVHEDEEMAIQDLSLDFIQEQISKRKQSNISHRFLVRGDDAGLIPPFDTYHVLPDRYFSQYPLYIYGPKLALISWHNPQRVILINDERFADSTRKLFNFVWDHTAATPRTKVKKV